MIISHLIFSDTLSSKNQNGNHKGTSITLTCGDSLAEAINKIGLSYSSHDNLHYTISSIQFGEFLEYLGFDLTKKSKTKIIPSKFLTTSKENLTAFLQGYFDGDGTISIKGGKSRVAVVTTSKVLANQIKCLLLKHIAISL